MEAGSVHNVSECSPAEAWAVLSRQASVLVDVRTRPEWNFVGVPELAGTPSRLIMAQWRQFPDMSVADNFAAELAAEIGEIPDAPLFFICRSGARSLDAARAMTGWLETNGIDTTCVNVTGGFEGDLDASRHRGNANGWKVSGLPWQQN